MGLNFAYYLPINSMLEVSQFQSKWNSFMFSLCSGSNTNLDGSQQQHWLRWMWSWRVGNKTNLKNVWSIWGKLCFCCCSKEPQIYMTIWNKQIWNKLGTWLHDVNTRVEQFPKKPTATGRDDVFFTRRVDPYSVHLLLVFVLAEACWRSWCCIKVLSLKVKAWQASHILLQLSVDCIVL